MPHAQYRILFIGGYLRIGSTLLDRLLGQVPGVFSAGEVRYVWSQGFLENQLCGCGKPFRDCPFWTAVADRAFGGFDRVPAKEALDLRLSVDRMWRVPQIAGPRITPRFGARLRRYREILGRLYLAIAEVSGSDVIVDSTKSASHGYLLRELPGARLSVLHMVRDSRAVAYSWTRLRRKPEVHWEVRYLPSYSPLRSALEWDAMNLGVEGMRAMRVPFGFLRYEDLVSQTRPWVGMALGLAGVTGADLSFIHEGASHLAPNHTASGNPSRFATGMVPIRADDEWEHALPERDRRLVTAMTWPLLRRYGYLRSKGSGATAVTPPRPRR